MNKVINTEKAPKAIGPYSQAIQTANGFLFISGQMPMNRENRENGRRNCSSNRAGS